MNWAFLRRNHMNFKITIYSLQYKSNSRYVCESWVVFLWKDEWHTIRITTTLHFNFRGKKYFKKSIGESYSEVNVHFALF